MFLVATFLSQSLPLRNHDEWGGSYNVAKQINAVADGHDYPFQVDHVSAWDHFIDTVREAASYRPDVRLSLARDVAVPEQGDVFQIGGWS